MTIKADIIRKSLILIGAATNSGVGSSGNKTSKAQGLAEEFVDSTIEEVMLSVRWSFAIRRLREIQRDGDAEGFIPIPDIDDCLKVAVIVPSNLEWYLDQGQIYFKGGKLQSIFYYSSDILERLLTGDRHLARIVPAGFISLAALLLVSQIGFALYSDSLFAEGLRKQYLIKLEEMRQTYSLNYNLVNSGVV